MGKSPFLMVYHPEQCGDGYTQQLLWYQKNVTVFSSPVYTRFPSGNSNRIIQDWEHVIKNKQTLVLQKLQTNISVTGLFGGIIPFFQKNAMLMLAKWQFSFQKYWFTTYSDHIPQFCCKGSTKPPNSGWLRNLSMHRRWVCSWRTRWHGCSRSILRLKRDSIDQCSETSRAWRPQDS